MATKYLPTPAMSYKATSAPQFSATFNKATSVPQLHLARRTLAALRSVSFTHHSLAVDLHSYRGRRSTIGIRIRTEP